MNATIVTDASFSNKYKIGTYAFYIVSNLGKWKKSGVLRNASANASQAEMKCICNALVFISRNIPLMEKLKNVYINTDSMNAIHLFTHDEPAIKKWGLKSKSYRKILTKYLEIKKLFEGKQFIYSHIKAHKTTSTPVTWVQQWADDTAKAEMHKKLTQLNKPSNKNKYDKPNPTSAGN